MKTLYFVSLHAGLEKEVLYPKKPGNIWTATDTIPRISLFDNIGDALSVSFLGQKIDGKEVYVYIAQGLRNENLLSPELSIAPYLLKLQGREWWYCGSLRLRSWKKIQVLGPGKEEIFLYGPRQKKEKFYRWKWKEVLEKWEKNKMKLRRKLFGEKTEDAATIGTGALLGTGTGLLVTKEGKKLYGSGKVTRLCDKLRISKIKGNEIIMKPDSLRYKLGDTIEKTANTTGKVLKENKKVRAGVVVGSGVLAAAGAYHGTKKKRKKKDENARMA